MIERSSGRTRGPSVLTLCFFEQVYWVETKAKVSGSNPSGYPVCLRNNVSRHLYCHGIRLKATCLRTKNPSKKRPKGIPTTSIAMESSAAHSTNQTGLVELTQGPY